MTRKENQKRSDVPRTIGLGLLKFMIMSSTKLAVLDGLLKIASEP